MPDEQAESRSYPHIANTPIPDEIASRCLITAARLHQAMSVRPTLLIDLRHAREYERAHIPGAINIAGALLPHKKFVRARSAVLVDAGHSRQQVLRTCERLIRKGFVRVHALDGGMAAWVSAGYDTTGTHPSQTPLLSLSPREVSTVLGERRWILVIDPTEASSLPQDLAALARIDLTDDVSALADQIHSHTKPGTSMPGVLLISSIDDVVQTASHLARRLQDHAVRIAPDGLAGIQAYRAQRKAMMARPEGGVLGQKRCGG